MDFTIQEDGGETVKVKGGTTCAPQKFKVSTFYWMKIQIEWMICLKEMPNKHELAHLVDVKFIDKDYGFIRL